MTTSIAYDAPLPYDYELVYYDGTEVRWRLTPSETSPGVALSETAIGGSALTEQSSAMSLTNQSASVSQTESTEGSMTVSDES